MRPITLSLLAIVTLSLSLSVTALAGTLYGTSHVGGSSAPSTLWRICPSSGEAFQVGPIGFINVGSIAFHPLTGELYGVGRRPDSMDRPRVLITIDPATGAGSEIGPLLNSWNLNGGGHFDLTFRPSDSELFMLAFIDDQPVVTLFQIDIFTGEATPIGPIGPSGIGNALTFDSADRLWTAQDNGGNALIELNPLTGAALSSTALSFSGFPALNAPRPNGMVGEHAGGPVYVAVNDGSGGSGPNYLGALEISSGTVAYLGLSVPGLDGLAFDVSGTLRMDQTIRASASGESWEWLQPLSFDFVVGSFIDGDDIGSYVVDSGGSGNGVSLAAPVTPVAPGGDWYLLRPACPEASWSSGGSAECPPLTCPDGSRDSLLP